MLDWVEMRILITGATGFLGSKLVPVLRARGHEVIALGRSRNIGDEYSTTDSSEHKIINADLSTAFSLDGIKKIDAVFTLAQEREFRQFPNRANEIFGVNVAANIRIWEWAARSGVKQIIHASSGGVYGSNRSQKFSENIIPSVEGRNSYYLGSKLCAEIAFQSFAPLFGSAILFRPFFIYGPEQDSDKFVQRIIGLVRDRQTVDLDGDVGLRTNPIFVEDAARIFADGLSLSGIHRINCAGSEIVTLKDLCSKIGKIMNTDPVFYNAHRLPEDCVGDIELQNQLFGPTSVSLNDGLRLTIQASS